ncbi:MATE family efflux transporter [Microbacterium sp. NPDC091382]|uniref:MATE family efflux transporter n=1 Tax=Microbacterium sp. NPDC091382 TaxID=3364210 RepID=UPI00382A6B5B
MATSLTTGRPWRVILLFTLPLMIGNVVQQLYHFADTIVVGRLLGVDALAAVGATGSLLFLLLGFAWGLTSGFAIPTAQAYGAMDADGVRRSVATGAFLSGITTIILTVGAPLIAEPALVALQTPPELLADATIFTQVSFLGAGALMFFNFLSAVIRAIGDSRTPLIFLIVSCGLNVVLVIAAIAWLGLGVAGAALATVIAQATSVLLCLEFVRRRIPELHLRREDWRITRADIVAHLRLGLPMGFQASIIAIGALTVQVALNTLGGEAIAAYTAASRVDGLAVALLQSMSLAVSMYVAQNYGAGRPDRIRRGVVQATWIALGAAVALGILLISLGGPIVRIFVGDGADEVVHLAVSMLVINGLSYTALGVLFVTRGALQGLGNAVIPTVTGVVELIARAVAAILLGSLFGFIGVAWSNPLAWISAAVILIPSYIRAHKRLATMPMAPMTITPTTPIAVIGPVDGSMTVETVVTQPVPLPQVSSRMRRALRRRPGAARRLARKR